MSTGDRIGADKLQPAHGITHPIIPLEVTCAIGVIEHENENSGFNTVTFLSLFDLYRKVESRQPVKQADVLRAATMVMIAMAASLSAMVELGLRW